MKYTAVGGMSGSSMDGLDIACIQFSVVKGKWNFKILAATTKPISAAWIRKLTKATELQARDYLLLHTAFGNYCGIQIAAFLNEHSIRDKIDCIGFHGHTTFHLPGKQMTHQLGEGAALAGVTGIPAVSDLRALDIALGGQGAPIVPIGEKLLFTGFDYFLNIGGIANISIHKKNEIIAFDVCPANRVLNMLSALSGKKFDKDGLLAEKGTVNKKLLRKLNSLKYYSKAYPKSLANDFGTDIVYPLIRNEEKNVENALSTYAEHIAQQVRNAIVKQNGKSHRKLFMTGGGVFNKYLVSRLRYYLEELNVSVIIPDEKIINYKEALVMALIAVLRLRNEPNVLATVTGAAHDSCNGALWSGK